MSIFKEIKSMFRTDEADAVCWNTITNSEQIEEIIQRSHQKPQMIYKHSNRCSVCWFAKSELESSADEIEAKAEMHFIDVVNSREVSNYIADKLGVRHESPQAILLKDGEGVWHDSHGAIKSAKILNMLE